MASMARPKTKAGNCVSRAANAAQHLDRFPEET